MDNPQLSNESIPAAIAGLRELLERAQRGDATALPELRAALETQPGIWKHCGDLAAIAVRSWIAQVAGSNLVVAESLTLQLAELRGELSVPSPTPLERVAIDRIAITWLQVWYSDVAAASLGDVSSKVATYALERQGLAQKRHLAALVALATIRRLLPRAGNSSADGDHGRPASGPGLVGASTDSDEARGVTAPKRLTVLSAVDLDQVALARSGDDS